MKTRNKTKFHLKILEFFGIKRSKANKIKKIRIKISKKQAKQRELESHPDYIYNHREIRSTYPPNWKNRVSIVTSTGEIIDYNPVENQIETDRALEKLKKEAIKGQTLEDLN